jgi:ABC-2 type transport system ATP-binding protein
MIVARNILKSFDGKIILNGISMNVRKGEIYGFIGHNGAGKTTTLNILAGLSRPDGGYCRVNGKDISLLKYPGELKIGYLPEEPKLHSWMTAYENLEYLMDETNSKKIQELLSLVGLETYADKRSGSFSRGMKQRLGIAAAMAKDPDLLILDEPSSALDPEGRAQVLDLILRLKEMGKTVIFSTHILSDVERICDTVGIIREGMLTVEKPLRELDGIGDGWIFEISLGDKVKDELREGFRSLGCVTGLYDKENGIRVNTNGDPLSSVELMKVLVENQVQVVTFLKDRPSLEEIFLEEVAKK